MTTSTSPARAFEPDLPQLRRRTLCTAALAPLVCPGSLFAQAGAAGYPSQPVRRVVPFVPGGTSDALARYIGNALLPDWKQPVVIDNKAGAGGIIGTDAVAKAAPDGYTIGMIVSAHTIQPAMDPKPPYHALNDFTFIVLVTRVPKVLVAYPGVPAKDLRQTLELVRSNTAQYGLVSSSGVGSAAHLGMEVINNAAKVHFTHVPYKGTGAAVTDLIAGQVPFMITDINNALPLVRSGKAKAITLMGAARSPLLPDVGTLNEVFPGQTVYELYGFVGPKNMPAAIVQKINADVAKVLASQGARDRFTTELGIEFANGSPDEFRKIVGDDITRWTTLVREANIKLD